MSDAPLLCCKCNGPMAQGFVVEKTHVNYEVSRWVSGPPQRSFWTTVKVPNDSLPIGAFRCSECGYMEFYADKVFEMR
jgi:hypothetical protein